MVFWRFIHVADYMHNSSFFFFAEYYSIVSIYHNLLIHSPVAGHLHCLQFWVHLLVFDIEFLNQCRDPQTLLVIPVIYLFIHIFIICTNTIITNQYLNTWYTFRLRFFGTGSGHKFIFLSVYLIILIFFIDILLDLVRFSLILFCYVASEALTLGLAIM